MVRTTPESIRLWGGALCLDFANTVDWDAELRFVDPDRTDVLISGSWVGRWARRVGIPGRGRISDAEVERLRELRLAIHRIFSSPDPPDRDLTALQDTVAGAVGAAALSARGEGPSASFAPKWPGSDERRVRFAVAWDALSLLGDPERFPRVNRCPGRNCGWLFVNASGRRRWCSMRACGSREKMRRAYARKRRGSGSKASS
jgi:predicted RNA-binding Zn ribbon-like protein